MDPPSSAATFGNQIALAPAGMDPRPPTRALRIWTLGGFRVERQGQVISQWRRQAAPTLLKVLLLADQHRMSREQLAYRMYPSANGSVARRGLNLAVHALRLALEPDLGAASQSRYLMQEGETLVLRLGQDDWVDLLAFEQALDAAEQEGNALPRLEAAAALYGGDLMPEEAASWCLAPRQALQLRWHGLLLSLSEAQARHGQPERAAATLTRMLSEDPTQEEAAYRLMALLGRQGRRPDALRIYGTFKAALRRELHALPAPETQALARALQAGAPLPHRRAGKSAAPATRTPDPARSITPLIGRADYQERLRTALLAAREGCGRAVLLLGEAGIGKTRLAEEAAAMATLHGFTTLRGQAGEGEQDLPYAPIIEVLRAYACNRPPQALRRDLNEAPVLATLMPELAGAPLGLGALAPTADSGAERLRLWQAIRTLLAAACERRPVLLILEDLHWADEGSLGLLAFLARRCYGIRLLLLATVRDEGCGNRLFSHLTLEGQYPGSIELLRVGGLLIEEVGDLAARILGSPLTTSQAVALHAWSGGNPLIINELMALLRSEIIGPPGIGLDKVLAGEGVLPRTIRQMLTRRLDGLSIACRSLLRSGALIGRQFGADLLARVAGQDRTVVEETLDEAVAAGMLREGDQGQYTLIPDLLRRALCEELMPRQRRRLHEQMARVLSEPWPRGDESGPDVRGYLRAWPNVQSGAEAPRRHPSIA
jgi:DNA-binding SARP family transcriptional activator